MSRLLLSLLLASLVSFTTLSADMKGTKHDTQMPASCKMHDDAKCDCAMKKTEGEMSSHCKMMSEKPACDCKNGAECKCKASGKECKCDAKSDVKAAKCGCGMTVESCSKMMPSCKYRDAREGKTSATCSMHSKADCKCSMKNEKAKMPASCKMHGEAKSDHKMSHDKMVSEKPACDCKNGAECKCKASGKECKCGAKSDVKAAKCSCGMTIESCKEMMPSCKYRDSREAKEAKK